MKGVPLTCLIRAASSRRQWAVMFLIRTISSASTHYYHMSICRAFLIVIAPLSCWAVRRVRLLLRRRCSVWHPHFARPLHSLQLFATGGYSCFPSAPAFVASVSLGHFTVVRFSDPPYVSIPAGATTTATSAIGSWDCCCSCSLCGGSSR